MTSYTQTQVLPSTYRDSVWLLNLARTMEDMPGVQRAAAMMGAPHNKVFLQEAGLLTVEGEHAGPYDLLLCVQTNTIQTATEALQTATAQLTQAQQRQASATAAMAPRTLATALRRLPEANLACISIPGEYAAQAARQALQHGLHVFLFSAHVSLQAEAELKHLAAQNGLLVMGPDCGTAVLNGVPLGFANRLPRGPVGLIAASGTGLQEVCCLLAQQGIGVSQAIGVGGRDLHEHIGGHSTRAALQALALDTATQVVVLISKPPAPAVATLLAREAAQLGKPCVLAFLGHTSPQDDRASLYPVTTLEDAALVAGALVRGEALSSHAADLPDLQAVRARLGPAPRTLRALYCGGTLAYEALELLRQSLECVASNLDGSLTTTLETVHTVLDLGAEEYTQGRPHPMLDPSVRRQYLLDLARDPGVSLVLCDVILGWGAHADPAGALATAWREAQAIAQADGRTLVGIAHVCGTAEDPQGLEQQRQVLREHGFLIAPSNAQAVRLAAAVLQAEDSRLPVSPRLPLPQRTVPPGGSRLSGPAHVPALFTDGPRVINLGLEIFATHLMAQGVPVIHVDWRPPAGGDARLASLLARLR